MRIRKFKRPEQTKRYRINHQIKAPQVRLVGEGGSEIIELSKALRQAQQAGLDLVEVTARADPPVARVVDYQKFLYGQKQKLKKGKGQAQKGGETKELRFRPVIGKNDLEQRIRRAEEFLKKRCRVKITVQFRGREVTHPEIGRDKLDYFAKALKEVAEVEREPKLERKMMTMFLVPK